MAHGKMKTLHGLYKRMGREAFLEAARCYSNHVHGSIDTTVGEMESRWYDSAHTITEAEKMVEDYNNGTLLGPHNFACVDLGQADMSIKM